MTRSDACWTASTSGIPPYREANPRPQLRTHHPRVGRRRPRGPAAPRAPPFLTGTRVCGAEERETRFSDGDRLAVPTLTPRGVLSPQLTPNLLARGNVGAATAPPRRAATGAATDQRLTHRPRLRPRRPRGPAAPRAPSFLAGPWSPERRSARPASRTAIGLQYPTLSPRGVLSHQLTPSLLARGNVGAATASPRRAATRAATDVALQMDELGNDPEVSANFSSSRLREVRTNDAALASIAAPMCAMH